MDSLQGALLGTSDLCLFWRCSLELPDVMFTGHWKATGHEKWNEKNKENNKYIYIYVHIHVYMVIYIYVHLSCLFLVLSRFSIDFDLRFRFTTSNCIEFTSETTWKGPNVMTSKEKRRNSFYKNILCLSYAQVQRSMVATFEFVQFMFMCFKKTKERQQHQTK